MRLCFVGDPRSVHTQRWVKWFAAHHDVGIACTSVDNSLSDFRVCTLPGSGGPPGWRLGTSVLALRRALRRHAPDILHAHFINEAGWFAAAAASRPLIITAWGSDIYRAPTESHLARRLNPWAVRAADCVTCDSRDQARVLRSWGTPANNIAIVGWGVDHSTFHPGVDGTSLRARLRIPTSAHVLLSPRQWLPNSNIATVIEAHALLAENVFLVLKRLSQCERGAGSTVEGAIAASPARNRIRVVDEIPECDLPALYAAADVVISLCTSDGTPVSVLEAMALGRPVVALSIPSLAEWLSEPGGRLVETLQTAEVADAVSGFLADKATRQRAALHNLSIVTARADRDAEMTRMNEIYERLASREIGTSRGV